jgi:hypothetical protein
VRNFVFSPVTRQLFVSHTEPKVDDLLYQWNVDTRALQHTYHLGDGYMCDSVTLSPDGRFAVVGCVPHEFGEKPCKTLIIDIKNKRITHDLGRKERNFHDVQFDRDGKRFLMTEGIEAKPVVYDTSGKTVDRFDPADFASAKNERVWVVQSSKMTIRTHGLYCRDAKGRSHRLTHNQWHHNYGLTKDKRYVAATTWDGEFIVWRLSDAKEMARKKMARQYGRLQYDPKNNRFLWGDASYDGTTKLKILAITNASK